MALPASGRMDPRPKGGGLVTDNHEGMHGGEFETSILLHVAPELVRAGFEEDDFVASDRTPLHITGVAGYFGPVLSAARRSPTPRRAAWSWRISRRPRPLI
jgi:creatinine amidohydrolase/Fe(II)-dependent formamide hydrolase-like protein